MLTSNFNAVSLFTISEYTTDMCIMKTDANGIHEWNQTFGGGYFDFATAVIQTEDGKYLVAGSMGWHSHSSGENGVVIKMDVSDSLEWNKKYRRNIEDCFTTLLQMPDGYLLVSNDFRLLKITTTGDEVWNQTYGVGMGDSYDVSMIHTADGGIVLFGLCPFETLPFVCETDSNNYTVIDTYMTWHEAKSYCESQDGHLVTITSEAEQSLVHSLIQGRIDGVWIGLSDERIEGTWEWVTGEELRYTNWVNGEPPIGVDYAMMHDGSGEWDGPSETGFQNRPSLLVKIDPNGIQEWNKTYTSNMDRTSAIIQTADGGFLLVGSQGGQGWIQEWDSIVLIKTDTIGTITWNQTITDCGSPSVNSILQTADDGFLVAGTDDEDMLLIKTDINGVMTWNQTYGGTSWDEASTLIQTTDSGYLLAGWTESHGAGGKDMYLVKIKPNGTLEWEKTYGGSEDDAVLSAIQTTDGGFILAGYTTVLGDPQISFGRCAFWLFLIGIIGIALVIIRFFTFSHIRSPIRIFKDIYRL
jgi:hypothetical protein